MLGAVRRRLVVYEALRAAKLENGEGPAEVFDPRLPGMTWPVERREPRLSEVEPGPLPGSDTDIAFAPVARLAVWIRRRELTSERLTRIYLGRLKRHGPRLRCVVTLTAELALEQARRADRETREGKLRGPLHGVPWGAKDLFDTRGVRTTWGAGPYRERRPEKDATVVRKLAEAGAVLVAKLSMGALAYGDIWFEGRTRNPFDLEQGSSGSSAGPGAATAAGLVGFSLGTETYGSIASPSARCGTSGLRPTFGRVSRAGAMALCWSLDKVGPMCRTVEDCALVVDAIAGPDPSDPATRDNPLNIDMTRSVSGVRVGHVPDDFEKAGPEDRRLLEILERRGARLVEARRPEGDFARLIGFLIDVEAATAFDELTRQGLDDQLKWQETRAWPNKFRAARLVTAVEYLQAARLRRRAMTACAELFADIDVFVAPSRRGGLDALTNLTGHPALTIRHSFRDNGTPRGVTLWGRLFDESTLLGVGAVLERELGLWDRRPPEFARATG
ncbi:MAG: amidase [Planctomycetota bacterium]|nr:amidase [Planctomycetota bacterium]